MEKTKILLALTYRMNSSQPHGHRGTLEFLVWLSVKPKLLTLLDTWLNSFLSYTDSFKAGTIGLCQGELPGDPRCLKTVV